MIIIPHTRTKRLSVKLKELEMGQAIALAELPAERHELTTTEFLRFVAAGAERPLPSYVTEPALWSVEERMLLVTKYLAHVADDGPDFSVGTGNLSDYVMFDRDLETPAVALGKLAGKECTMYPLLGGHAQVLETLCASRGDWIFGAIACQIMVNGDAPPDWAELSDVQMIEWVTGRVERLKKLPESDFSELYAGYWHGAERLTHFFNLDFDDHGPVFHPVEKEGAGALGPARFRSDACLSDLAIAMARRPGQSAR